MFVPERRQAGDILLRRESPFTEPCVGFLLRCYSDPYWGRRIKAYIMFAFSSKYA